MTPTDAPEVKKEPTIAEKLTNAVEAAAKSWPPFGSGGLNLVDVLWLAQKIREGLAVALPPAPPPQAAGVKAVECVETSLLRDPRNRALRNTFVNEVARRIVALHAALNGVLPFPNDQGLVVSLYAWHGCLHMASLLRCVDAAGVLYTAEMRRRGYAVLHDDWEREAAAGNPWVRYGVSLARRLEQGRKKENFDYEVHENWVSRPSPYWDE
jgi:hypothetical protein